MITIQLNGHSFSLDGAATLEALLRQLALPSTAIAVAVNQEVVPRSAFAQTKLRAGDSVDEIQPVGGG